MIIIKEQESPSAALRSPSPVYAGVYEDKEKERQYEDCSVDKREMSQLPEYTEVGNVNKHSGYTMESNISYNTLQVSIVNTTVNNDHDEI